MIRWSCTPAKHGFLIEAERDNWGRTWSASWVIPRPQWENVYIREELFRWVIESLTRSLT